ncbi:DNA-3-methyladenine glycosylase [Nostocoides vanveenii]|uniref:Putative 3-methyladenine DNA glycosylase n=1 Tax=Nostocoides vanveenii TaxID=330835 RepID=A0ABN2KLD0_9MICO
MPRPPRLPRRFFAREVLQVAPDLLGCTITHAGVTVRVTETEAYAGYLHDPGSHAFRGRTPRTEPMFGPAGLTYVYFTYGMHWMLCLVTGPVDLAQAVLIRAGEVVDGLDVAAQRRPGIAPRDWCRGPARLATTLALDGGDTGRDFCRPALRAPAMPVEPIDLVVRAASNSIVPQQIRTGPRVGVSGPGGDGASYPWRFWLDGEPTVSTYRPGVTRSGRRTLARK